MRVIRLWHALTWARLGSVLHTSAHGLDLMLLGPFGPSHLGLRLRLLHPTCPLTGTPSFMTHHMPDHVRYPKPGKKALLIDDLLQVRPYSLLELADEVDLSLVLIRARLITLIDAGRVIKQNRPTDGEWVYRLVEGS
jgi:hypothetical protein